jgi:hypothetical protein
MILAFNSRHPYVPTSEQGRWIASLSDGSTVFQDNTPGEISAWRRLRQYINLHKLKITNIRLEAYGRQVHTIPYLDNEKRPQLNGYWQIERLGSFLNTNLPHVHWRGIGYVKGFTIHITWINQEGGVSMETRPLFRDEKQLDGSTVKQIDLGVILNDHP